MAQKKKEKKTGLTEAMNGTLRNAPNLPNKQSDKKSGCKPPQPKNEFTR